MKSKEEIARLAYELVTASRQAQDDATALGDVADILERELLEHGDAVPDAVEFAEWIDKYGWMTRDYKVVGNTVWMDDNDNVANTIEDVYEIFIKEKGK